MTPQPASKPRRLWASVKILTGSRHPRILCNGGQFRPRAGAKRLAHIGPRFENLSFFLAFRSLLQLGAGQGRPQQVIDNTGTVATGTDLTRPGRRFPVLLRPRFTRGMAVESGPRRNRHCSATARVVLLMKAAEHERKTVSVSAQKGTFQAKEVTCRNATSNWCAVSSSKP